MKQILIGIKYEYDNPPLILTENGYGEDRQLNDLDRINYVSVYLLK